MSIINSIRTPKASVDAENIGYELRLRGDGQICPENTKQTLVYKGQDGNMYVPDAYGRPSPLTSVYYRTPACQSSSIQINLENELQRNYSINYSNFIKY